MKKLIPFLFLLLSSLIIVPSCAYEPSLNSSEKYNNASNHSVNGRSLSEAAALAQQALGMLNDNKSRSSNRSFSLNNVKYFVTSSSRSNSSDTLFYVFNFDNNEGFAVIAYNKNVPGIIAVTELGSYNPEQESDNVGFEWYMQATKQLLLNVESNGATPKPLDSLKTIDTTIIVEDVDTSVNKDLVQYKFETKDILKVKIEPNYNLRWGQSNPEGLLFENGLCGCANTAMIMLMSYFEWPNRIPLNFPNAPQQYLNLDWTQIKEHRQSGYYADFDLCNNTTHSTIAMLCKQLAYFNGSHCYFKPDTTTATIVGREKTTFETLGYNVSNDFEYNSNIILSKLTDKIKFFINGKNLKTGSGHAFIIDGIDYYDYWSGEYIKRYGEDWELVNDHGITQNRFNHINWGWNGVCNGFFSSMTLDALKCGNYDQYGRPLVPEDEKDNYKYVITSMYYVY